MKTKNLFFSMEKTKRGFGRFFTLVSILSVSLLSTSCEGDDPEKGGDDDETGEQIIFNENEIGNGDQEFEITGKHTIKKGTYVLKGWVYIAEGAELTIEPGTVIKGDKATRATLIAERGGKLIAQGTSTNPIVFTSNEAAGSRKPGDWGGIVLCGNALCNNKEGIIEGGPRSKYGGDNDADNSGVLSYVRIEFAGYPFKTDEEINGLTMGAVGSGTKIDHVQVSYCNDDSFEWFGGAVNAKYLIAYHGWDDDFDTDKGYRGMLQYVLGIRNSKLADTSLSNGFESDNNSSTELTPTTAPIFSNVTLIGARVQDASFENTTSYINGGDYNPNNGSKLGQFQSAMQIRRGSNLSCFNSLFAGSPVGIMLENDKGGDVQGAADAGKVAIKNIVFAGMGILGSDNDKSFVDQFSDNSEDMDATKESFSASFFKREGFANAILDYATLNLEGKNFAPQSGSPLLAGADFTDAKLQNSFFDKVSFKGAFGTEDWSAGWANFDPQNTVY